MSTPFTVECNVRFQRRGRGAPKELRAGPTPERPALPSGRVGRIARLMALALRFEELIRTGAIANRAELARLGHVTSARISQITNLLHLAPDIQECLLFYLGPARGRDPIHLAWLQPIAAVMDWKKQRRLWQELTGNSAGEIASKNRPANLNTDG
jgi:hypothetical protein